ncbi:MAG: electron transport complex subunit RsxC, partial [Nitrosomonadales bacterium]|nr:electron transport complex subunit RsxC [Nitrosomonadales bacterium]
MNIIDTIFKFNGGIKADTKKSVSTVRPIKKIKMPKQLILPLRQHVGKVAKLKVNIGEKVLKGQLLAEADGNVSAAIHA